MSRRSGLLVAAAMAAGMSVMTGCVDTAGTTITTDHAAGSTLVTEDNTRLKDQLQVLRVTYDDVNGLKRVHITLASTKHARLHVDYRIIWLDANGMELDPDVKTYRSLRIEGRDAVTVTGLANSTAATTSKLRVRDAAAAD
jgi:uncharacterized protein YcfL